MVDIKIQLPEDFLKEEERCGYHVGAKTKSLWAMQLDLLAELDRVCKAYGITYFAIGGTLLGAVRHKGYIPWDNDLDVAMLRQDYERLKALPRDAFGQGYFLQWVATDAVVRGHAQLRRDGTTCLTSRNFGQEFHRGIFIDIFVWDALPDARWKQRPWELWARLAYGAVYLPFMRPKGQLAAMPWPKRTLTRMAKKILGVYVTLCGGKEAAYRRYEKICQAYAHKNTKQVGDMSFLGLKHQVFACDKEAFATTVELPFEHLMIPCPVGYFHVLEKEYGDWRTFLPGDDNHGALFFDASQSYEVYDALDAQGFLALFKEG